jgi:ectoine hydroxylase-related dioxygenase (phytanoyl-CoA dioxygenase family)
MILDDERIKFFKKNGAVLIRKAIPEYWIEQLRNGVAYNMATPGKYTRNYTKENSPGFFWGDYCNWQRIPEYKSFFFDSPAAAIAAQLMTSQKVNLFHEHVLVKEPGTLDRTPWHHDQPYYCVNGNDTCSLWIPLDPVPKATCVQFIARSHKWGRWFTPTKFVGVEYAQKDEGFEPMPDIDSNITNYELLSWELEPGDCIAFNFLTVHGAPGNVSGTSRRRAFAARFTGDDATFTRRVGQMSPPFPELSLNQGDRLDSTTFPVLFDC